MLLLSSYIHGLKNLKLKACLFLVLWMGVFPLYAYQAVIFDCDGVLVDTEYLKFQAWQQAFASRHKVLQEADYLPLVGQSSEAIAKALQQEKRWQFDAKQLIVEKDAIYTNLQQQGVPAFAEAVTFLKKLLAHKKALNLKVGMASSAKHAEILENLKQLGIDPHSFDVIISGTDDLKMIQDPEGTNKPKPYIYQLAAQKMQVAPQDCLVFEDSGAGVIAAAKAGMSVVAIPNQYTQQHDFSLAKAITSFKVLTWEKFTADKKWDQLD